MRGEATLVTIIFAAFMSLLAPLMILNPMGMLTSYPEIVDARVAPEKIPPGAPLYITAWVKDPAGIETVFVYIENEAGVDRLKMTLSSGSLYDGMFEAKWISHDTLDKKWYNATIIATNTMNLSSYTILPWQDPTQGHAASQVRAGTFSAGNYAFPNNLTAGGTLFVDNSTGRVGIGTTGPGQKLVVIGNANITESLYVGGDEISPFPTGMISPFYLESCPLGWLFCDGTFGTPDLRGRMIVGNGTITAGVTKTFTYNETGGEVNHTLTIDEMSSHTHSVRQPIQSTLGGGGVSYHYHSQLTTTGSAGNDQSHENMPPYRALIYCMKS